MDMGVLYASAFAACVIVFPIYLISTAITTSVKRRGNAKQLVISRGHVVTAVLKKNTRPLTDVPGVLSDRACFCTYEYDYKGKTYKYRYWDAHPSPTLKLYFLRNPRKATVDANLNDSNVCWPVVYLVVTILAYWVMTS